MTEPGDEIALLSRYLAREMHLVERNPELLASHLHNALFLGEGEDRAGTLLACAREALVDRSWLRLVNRPVAASASRPLVRVLDHGAPVRALAWSRDGRELASAGDDGAVQVWNARSGRPSVRFGGEAEQREEIWAAVDWSPAAPVLATAFSYGGTAFAVNLWDPASGNQLDELRGHSGHVRCLAWSPNGAVLASGGSDREVRLWRPEGDEPPTVLQAGEGPVLLLAWSPDGRVLVSGDDGPVLRLWDRDGARLGEWRIHDKFSSAALGWSPDGKTVVSGGHDGTLRIWDVDREEELAVWEDTRWFWDQPRAWSPDCRTFAEVTMGKTAITLFDLETGIDTAALEGHSGNVTGLAWAPDGGLLASGTGHGTVNLWNPSAAAKEMSEDGHRSRVTSLAWRPGQAMLVSGGADHTVRLWDARDGRQLHVIDWHEKRVERVACSPDGKYLASEDTDTAYTARLAGTRPVAMGTPAPFAGRVHQLAWRPRRRRKQLALLDGDGRLRLCWKNPAVWRSRELDTPRGAGALAWSPDGGTLAGGGRIIQLWDVDAGRAPLVLAEPPRPVSLLLWSPDGSLLAAGEQGGAVRLWRRASREPECTFEGHTTSIQALAWHPAGSLLAAAGKDATVRVWDTGSATCLAVAHCLSEVGALAFDPDGTILRAADKGFATGNRPIPYVFELTAGA